MKENIKISLRYLFENNSKEHTIHFNLFNLSDYVISCQIRRVLREVNFTKLHVASKMTEAETRAQSRRKVRKVGQTRQDTKDLGGNDSSIARSGGAPLFKTISSSKSEKGETETCIQDDRDKRNGRQKEIHFPRRVKFASQMMYDRN